MNNNADFWASIEAIINDGFSTEGLQKLDRYAEQFISREFVYKRFSPLEQHGCSTGGTTHVIATILAGAKIDTDTFTSGISDFKRMLQCGEKQAERIERWEFNYTIPETGFLPHQKFTLVTCTMKTLFDHNREISL